MVYVAVAPQQGLRQGLFAKGSIELQQLDALAVPVSAVRIEQSRPYVITVLDGKTAQRVVSLGARGEAMIDGKRDSVVEVTEGLSSGNVLLRGSLGQVRDGTAVQLPQAAPASPRAASASR